MNAWHEISPDFAAPRLEL